jgi:hypothetical protein
MIPAPLGENTQNKQREVLDMKCRTGIITSMVYGILLDKVQKVAGFYGFYFWYAYQRIEP